MMISLSSSGIASSMHAPETHRQLNPVGTTSHPSHVHIRPEQQRLRAGLTGPISFHTFEETDSRKFLVSANSIDHGIAAAYRQETYAGA